MTPTASSPGRLFLLSRRGAQLLRLGKCRRTKSHTWIYAKNLCSSVGTSTYSNRPSRISTENVSGYNAEQNASERCQAQSLSVGPELVGASQRLRQNLYYFGTAEGKPARSQKVGFSISLPLLSPAFPYIPLLCGRCR
jgi:hypothetical protein